MQGLGARNGSSVAELVCVPDESETRLTPVNGSRLEARTLTDVLPRPVRIAASRAAHLLRAAVHIDGVGIIAAIFRAALIRLTWHDLAIASIVGVFPLTRRAGRAALQRFKLGLLRELPVALIQAAPDFATNDAADHSARNRRQDVAAAFTDLVADDAASHRAKHSAAVRLANSVSAARCNRQSGCQTCCDDNPMARAAHVKPRSKNLRAR